MTIKIEGIAAVSGWSGNKRYYPAEELAKLNGHTVPLLWIHKGTPAYVGDLIPTDKIIGEATVYWRKDIQQLWYQGWVEGNHLLMVRAAKGVSMGAHYRKDLLFTTDIILEEISLVTDAGIPDTTIKQVKEYSWQPPKTPLMDLASRLKVEYHMKARVAVS